MLVLRVLEIQSWLDRRTMLALLESLKSKVSLTDNDNACAAKVLEIQSSCQLCDFISTLLWLQMPMNKESKA